MTDQNLDEWVERHKEELVITVMFSLLLFVLFFNVLKPQMILFCKDCVVGWLK